MRNRTWLVVPAAIFGFIFYGGSAFAKEPASSQAGSHGHHGGMSGNSTWNGSGMMGGNWTYNGTYNGTMMGGNWTGMMGTGGMMGH